MLAALLLAAAGSVPTAALEQADVALDRATRARHAEAFRALLEPDARFGSASGWAEGPDAVLALWKPFLTPGGPTLTWAPDHAEIAASGDLGFTSGRWQSEAREAGGKPVAREGRYATVWRRGADGAWRVALDVGVEPPAAAAARTTTTTLASEAGDLVAEAGTFAREGTAGGIWLFVRRRDAGGRWATLVETELPARR